MDQNLSLAPRYSVDQPGLADSNSIRAVVTLQLDHVFPLERHRIVFQDENGFCNSLLSLLIKLFDKPQSLPLNFDGERQEPS